MTARWTNRRGADTGDQDSARPESSSSIDAHDVRAELQVRRDVLVDRLHRRSDDFEATHELRLVNEKLRRTSYGTQVVFASS